MLADMAMKVEAARQLVYVAASPGRAWRARPRVHLVGRKCLASDTAMQVTTDAVQLLGGAGYTRTSRSTGMMRDAKITQIYEGTNQIQRIVMARSSACDLRSGNQPDSTHFHRSQSRSTSAAVIGASRGVGGGGVLAGRGARARSKSLPSTTWKWPGETPSSTRAVAIPPRCAASCSAASSSFAV